MSTYTDTLPGSTTATPPGDPLSNHTVMLTGRMGLQWPALNFSPSNFRFFSLTGPGRLELHVNLVLAVSRTKLLGSVKGRLQFPAAFHMRFESDEVRPYCQCELPLAWGKARALFVLVSHLNVIVPSSPVDFLSSFLGSLVSHFFFSFKVLHFETTSSLLSSPTGQLSPHNQFPYHYTYSLPPSLRRSRAVDTIASTRLTSALTTYIVTG